METYKNLWKENDLENIKSSDIIDFLQSQCNFFNEKNGVLMTAKLVEMQYYQSTISALTQSFSTNMSLLSGRYEYSEEKIQEKENINNVLKNLYYSFVIYNSKYRFNVFYISIYQYYPIKVEVDFDISKELNLQSNMIEIVDFESLEEWITKIFNSNKLKCVINKLRETSI